MLLWAVLALFVVFVILVVFFRDLLYAAVALALASIMLTVVLFHYGANIAAVFELSVCAGLITVLFVSTISLTKNSDQKAESRVPAYFLPFIFILLVGLDLFLAGWLTRELLAMPAAAKAGGALPQGQGLSFNRIFWETRATDLWGQVSLILAGVFGILAIFRATAAKNKKEKEASHE